jgi:hypothetical protein
MMADSHSGTTESQLAEASREVSALLANQRGPSSRDVTTLDPPNELPHFMVPPQHEAASTTPMATDAIARGYPQAIEFADAVGEVAGNLATVGLVLVFVVGGLLYGGIKYELGWISHIIGSLLLLVTFVMVRQDFHGHLYTPVLFNRGLGQVHVMESLPLSWTEFFFMPWRIAGKTRIHSFPWSCVRGEVASLQIFQGQVLRTEFNLFLAFTEAPESNRVVYRASVGTTTAYDDGQGCVNRWEHIRRFMRHEGPGFRAGDRPWTNGAVSFWRGFFYGQMLLGPGSGKYWRTGSLWVYVTGVLSLFILPMTAYHGLVKWACCAIRPQPKWPAEILASIGPEVEFDELQRVAPGTVTPR